VMRAPRANINKRPVGSVQRCPQIHVEPFCAEMSVVQHHAAWLDNLPRLVVHADALEPHVIARHDQIFACPPLNAVHLGQPSLL